MPKTPTKTSKKKKYNARFPPARIKKIMQTDEEVGKVAAAVPVIISRALELFIDSLITETSQTTIAKNAKTLSTSHIKQTIESKKQFDFLRDLVSSIPDHQTEENNGDTAHQDGEVLVKKGRGRPHKVKDRPSGKMSKGESSKASTDTSDDEEEDEEETDTDEESANQLAPSTSTTISWNNPVMLSQPQNDRLSPGPEGAQPSVIVPHLEMYTPPDQNSGHLSISVCNPASTVPNPAVTGPTLQPAHTMLDPQHFPYRAPAHIPMMKTTLPIYQHTTGFPPYPVQLIPTYPYPLMRPGLLPPMSTSADPPLSHPSPHQLNTDISEQQQPMNLVYSPPSRAITEDDNYDT